MRSSLRSQPSRREKLVRDRGICLLSLSEGLGRPLAGTASRDHRLELCPILVARSAQRKGQPSVQFA